MGDGKREVCCAELKAVGNFFSWMSLSRSRAGLELRGPCHGVLSRTRAGLFVREEARKFTALSRDPGPAWSCESAPWNVER